jgi:hypothetical protein
VRFTRPAHLFDEIFMAKLPNPIIILVLITTSFAYAQQPRKDITGDFLLKTQWGDSEPYNKFAPGKHSLGCHSVAIAQICYYHQLAPFGKVKYQCSKGYEIDEDFSKHSFKWDSFIEKSNALKKNNKIDETARYMYFVSATVKKDFGTDQYIKCDDQHKSEVENHFPCVYDCRTKALDAFSPDVFLENGGFFSIIKKEIDLKRPLGFYYSNEKDSGHAVVIDGYVVTEKVFFVHANFGWKGKSDGWYNLLETLPKDIKLVALVTIKPKKQE